MAPKRSYDATFGRVVSSHEGWTWARADVSKGRAYRIWRYLEPQTGEFLVHTESEANATILKVETALFGAEEANRRAHVLAAVRPAPASHTLASTAPLASPSQSPAETAASPEKEQSQPVQLALPD